VLELDKLDLNDTRTGLQVLKRRCRYLDPSPAGLEPSVESEIALGECLRAGAARAATRGSARPPTLPRSGRRKVRSVVGRQSRD
jgi:hypothetical protein